MKAIIRLIRFIYNKIGGINLFILAILLISFRILVIGITSEIIDVQAVSLLPFAIGGVLAGWLVGMSALPSLAATVCLFALGMEWILLSIGHLWNAFCAVILDLTRITLHFDPLTGPQFSFPDFLPAINRLTMDTNTLFARVWMFSQTAAHGQSIVDPVVVSLIYTIAVFWLAGWAAWWSVRHKAAWLGLLPGAGLMAGVFDFTNSGYSRLILFAGLGLFTQIMLSLYLKEASWQKRQIDTPNLRGDFIRSALIISTVLVVLAWFTPSISPQDVKDFVDDVLTKKEQSSSPGNSVEGEPGTGQTKPFQGVSLPDLSRNHRIGAGPRLSRDLVMYVYIDGYTPSALPPQAMIPGVPGVSPQMPPRLYWRSLTYDRYNGSGWSSSPFTESDMAADQKLFDFDITRQPYKRIIGLQVEGISNLHKYLYVTGDLINVNKAYRVGMRTNQDLVGATTVDNEYKTTSTISIATPALLRSAGNNYPDWIRKRYLILPDDISPRVRDLAFQLTATKSNPYDRALAIEDYLRQIPYSLDVDAPPPDVEIADYFIFELKKGYCDDYATSMVVLARIAGLPTRLVTGYASGTWDPIIAAYVVTEMDAHSWVEAYFPGYGWIEFEPTGGFARFSREEFDLPSTITTLPDSLQPGPGKNSPGVGWKTNWFAFSLGGFALFLFVYILATHDSRRLLHMPGIRVVNTLYHRMLNQTQPLVGMYNVGLTPYEYRQKLLAGFDSITTQSRAIHQVINRLVLDVDWLVDLYVIASYSRKGIAWLDKEIAIKRWPCMHRNLLLTRLLLKVERLAWWKQPT